MDINDFFVDWSEIISSAIDPVPKATKAPSVPIVTRRVFIESHERFGDQRESGRISNTEYRKRIAMGKWTTIGWIFIN